MNDRGRPVSGLRAGARSQSAIPMSCCSAARHTSSYGSTAPNRALPQARASWPETHACDGWPIATHAAVVGAQQHAPLQPGRPAQAREQVRDRLAHLRAGGDRILGAGDDHRGLVERAEQHLGHGAGRAGEQLAVVHRRLDG